MQADDVARADHFLHPGAPARATAERDGHAKRLGDARDGAADAAGAHDAQPEAGQLDQGKVPVAEIGGLRPAAIAHGGRMVAGVTGQFEQQGEGVLGDGAGAVFRHIGDGNPARPRGGGVHDVVAGRQDADVAEARQLRQGGGGQRCLVG